MSLKKNKTANIKAIVFDLDDTLYPQISYKRSGFAFVSQWVETNQDRECSVVLSHLEEILNNHGPSYPYMFDRLVERLHLGCEIIDDLVGVFIQHIPQISCYDGVMPMLERLRKSYRLGILTDGRYSVQKKKIHALGLEEKVDEILCSGGLGLEKPACELFQWFESKFDLNGLHMMYVGDNPEKDFYGANQRNWTTVRVMTGENQNNDFDLSKSALFRISSIVDLEEILSG